MCVCVYPGATARCVKCFHSSPLEVNSIRRTVGVWHSSQMQYKQVLSLSWSFLCRFGVRRSSGHSGALQVTDLGSAYLGHGTTFVAFHMGTSLEPRPSGNNSNCPS